MAKCHFKFVWGNRKFPKLGPWTPGIIQEQFTRGCFQCSLSYIFYTSNFVYIIKKFVLVLPVPIYGILETPQWPKRTGNHNKAELPTYLWSYHLTGKVRASQSLFISLHQLSVLWKLLLDTQIPWNHSGSYSLKA